jgi:hypothetical protein
MLTKNNHEKKLVNGSRGVITRFHGPEEILEVQGEIEALSQKQRDQRGVLNAVDFDKLKKLENDLAEMEGAQSESEGCPLVSRLCVLSLF